MSNKGDGIGTIFINNKNYKGLKVGTSLVKRKYNIPDENGYTVLKIKCSTGSNILNIFNQLTSNVESVEIFNESNININANTTLPNLNVDNNSTSEYTTWTLPDGNYKVFIKGEFSIKDSTCEILKVKLQNNLTTGYKMFYNCNINSDYEIKIPDSMTNIESMFENSNINRTAKVNLSTVTKCSAMYKNCTNLKKIHINYIEAFNNENTSLNHDECFVGCNNIRCGNLNSDTNNKPAIFSLDNIPYSWGGFENYNTFEIEANDTNGLTLTLVKHLFETTNDDKSITYTPETLVRTDWGDGTIDNELSHTYSESGTYIVKTRLQPNNAKAENDDNKLIKKVINVRNDISSFSGFCAGCINMEQFNIDNKIYPINMNGMFYNCPSLTSIDMNKFDTINTVVLDVLFYECTSLNTIIGLENLKTKNVKSMYLTFAGTSITNVDLSKWDCTNIKYIVGLFYGCHKLQSVNLIGWDISKVDDLTSLFNECYELTSIKGIENWNTSKVKDMSGTFRELRALKTLDLSNWNVSNVQSMYGMFEGCSSLETPGDLSNWTTPALVNTDHMFNNTFKMKSLKLTNFDTSNLKQATANATYAANMFNGCTSLKEYDIVITFGDNNYIPFDNTSFDSSIKYITIKGTPDVARMTSFVSILKDQTATGAILDISQLLSEIQTSLMANTELVNKAAAKGWTFRQYSWDGMENFNTFEIEANDANGLTLTLAQYINNDGTAEALARTDWGDGAIDKELSHTYDKPGTYIVKTKLQPNNINTWDPSDITGGNYNKLNYNKLIKKVINVRNDIDNFVSFCGGCTDMEQFNIDNEIHPTIMAYMFDRCSSLTSIDVTKFNTTNTISLYWLFNECTSLNTIIGLEDLKVENVKDITYAFVETSIVNADLSKWKFKELTSIHGLFSGCKKLRSVNLTGWDISKVDNLILLFNECYELTSIKGIEYWNTSNVTSMGGTFRELRTLKTLDLSKWDVSKVKVMYAMFEGCNSLETLGDLSNWTTPNLTSTGNMFNGDSKIKSLKLTNLDTSKVRMGAHMFYGCTGLEEYDIVITFGNNDNNNIPFDKTSFDKSIKYITIKGTPDVERMKLFVDILSFQTTTGAILDISQLSDEIRNNLMADTTLVNNAEAKGWTFRLNTFEIEANNTNGLTLTLAEHLLKTINDDGTTTIIPEGLVITDWGDGTINKELSHTYNEPGTYIVKTTLQPNNINTYDPSDVDNAGNHNKLNHNELIKKVINVRNDIDNFISFCAGCTNMEQFNIDNTIHPIDMTYMFDSCSSLTSIDIAKFDTTNTINLGLLFYRCTSLNTIIGLENLNVENVQVMDCAFAGTKIVNADLSKWNLTKLTSIEGLFGECEKLQSVDLTGWDISRVKSFFALFSGCYELTSIKGIEDWDTSNVISMMAIFAELRALKTLDLSKWNTSKVTNMLMLFNGCSSLETLKLTNFDTSNVQAAISMFNGCTSLKEYDIVITFGNNNYKPFDTASFDSSIKYITIKGTPDIDRMTSFVDILKDQTATGAILDISQLSSEIQTSLMADTTLVNNAKAKGWTFRFNTFEIEANNTNGLTLTLAGHLFETFNDDGTLATTPENLAITDWGDGTINKELSHTYNEPGTYIVKTTLQPNNVNTWDPNNKEEPKDVRYNKLIKKVINVRNDIDNFMAFCAGCINMEQFNIDNEIHPIDMTYMFEDCSSLISIDVTKFDITNTFSLAFLFNGCTSLNTIIGLEDLNAENVQVMLYVFTGTSITNADLSKWNCKNISMHLMGLFYGCHKLQSVDLTGWDTSNVNIIMGVFHECYELTSIKGIENWDTSKVVVMANLFSELRALKTLDLSNWNVSSVESMNRMFEGCSSLETLGDLSNWTTPALIDTESMFNGDSKIKSLKLTNFNTSTLQKATNMFNGCTSLEEYDIVITFGNNNYMPFDTTSFDSSIKHITIKGTPDVTRMTSFINILKDQTATGGATLDVSQLPDGIKNNTELATNAATKGWVFIQQV